MFGDKQETRATAGSAGRAIDSVNAAQLGSKAVNSPYIDALRPSFRERVWSGVRRTESEIARHDQLVELGLLLDKNPEVARIIELMEALAV